MWSPSTEPNLKFKIQHGKSQDGTAKQAVSSYSLLLFFSFKIYDREEEPDLGVGGL